MDKPSVILVDDTQSFCTVAERELRAMAGGAVVTMNCGERALEHLALCGSKYPMPGLVLLDRVMPGMDGFEVLKEARAQSHLETLTIIMLSGSDDDEHVLQSRELGADAYVIKPVQTTDFPRFVAQVQQWLLHTREVKNLRGICMESGVLELSAADPLSLSKHAMQSPAALRTPPESIQGYIHQAVSYIFGGKTPAMDGLFVDRKAMELTRACRAEGVDEVDMYRATKDQVLVVKRHRVLLRLMDDEWANSEIVRRFGICLRTTKEVRSAWNKRKDSARLLHSPTRKTLG